MIPIFLFFSILVLVRSAFSPLNFNPVWQILPHLQSGSHFDTLMYCFPSVWIFLTTVWCPLLLFYSYIFFSFILTCQFLLSSVLSHGINKRMKKIIIIILDFWDWGKRACSETKGSFTKQFRETVDQRVLLLPLVLHKSRMKLPFPVQTWTFKTESAKTLWCNWKLQSATCIVLFLQTDKIYPPISKCHIVKCKPYFFLHHTVNFTENYGLPWSL